MRKENLVAFRTDNRQTECFWRLSHKVQHLLYLRILFKIVVYFMKLHMVKNNHTQGAIFQVECIMCFSIHEILNKYRGEVDPEENQFY